MDSVSSILKSSRKHIDMSKERPVRAGAPSYGQPVSEATHTFAKEKELENKNTLFPSARIQAEEAKLRSPDVSRHTGIIDRITLNFKGNSERPEKTETLDLEPEEVSVPQSESEAVSADVGENVNTNANPNETATVDIYA